MEGGWIKAEGTGYGRGEPLMLGNGPSGLGQVTGLVRYGDNMTPENVIRPRLSIACLQHTKGTVLSWFMPGSCLVPAFAHAGLMPDTLVQSFS